MGSVWPAPGLPRNARVTERGRNMGHLYRPKLKDTTPLPLRNGDCTHKSHGRTDQCPRCGARFSSVLDEVLRQREGRAGKHRVGEGDGGPAGAQDARGQGRHGSTILHRANRILYDEETTDLRRRYTTRETGTSSRPISA